MGSPKIQAESIDAKGFISGTVSGHDLAKALKRLGRKVENRIVNKALKLEMDKLHSAIQHKTPVDDGELEDSITLKRKYKKQAGVVLFDIASRGDVSRRAHLTEWGRDSYTLELWGDDARFVGAFDSYIEGVVTFGSTRPGARMFTRSWDAAKNTIVPNTNARIKAFVFKEWRKINRAAKREAKAKVA